MTGIELRVIVHHPSEDVDEIAREVASALGGWFDISSVNGYPTVTKVDTVSFSVA